jgi:hypothetical protein
MDQPAKLKLYEYEKKGYGYYPTRRLMLVATELPQTVGSRSKST